MDNNTIAILELKKDVSNVISKNINISNSDLNDILDSCIVEDNMLQTNYRLVVHLKGKYMHIKGCNLIFQPVKFIRLLLTLSVSLVELNVLSVLKIFCDVLELFSIELSQSESSILICLYNLGSKMVINDNNIYNLYVDFAKERNLFLYERVEFNNIIKKLLDANMIVIEDGIYYVEEKIIG